MKSIFALSAAALVAASPIELEDTPTTTAQCTQPAGYGAPDYVGEGTVCPCYGWEQIGRGEDCDDVAKRHGLSEETIIKWNPWTSDPTIPQYPCTRAGWGNNLCVDITYHPPAPPPPPPCQTNPPQGYRADTVCHCKKWHKPDHQDTCKVVEQTFGITQEQLVEWNPWLELKYPNGTVISDCMIVLVRDVMCVGL